VLGSGAAIAPFPETIASYRKHLVALSHGEEESYRQPQRIVRRDGAALWVELTINLMREAPSVPHGLVVTAANQASQPQAAPRSAAKRRGTRKT
jgi:hypothetical protein